MVNGFNMVNILLVNESGLFFGGQLKVDSFFIQREIIFWKNVMFCMRYD